MSTAESPKPYDLRFEVREGYLWAYVSGVHDSFAISLAYWTEVGEEIRKLGMKKVMVVEDIEEQSPLVDVYNLVTHIGEMGFRDVIIAFVDRHSEHQELNEFGVLVGSNRGLTAEAFGDEAEAEKWLLAR